MSFISIRKFKFYTKETLKIFNITLIALGFIIAIILIKYKPMYEVEISGEKVGYIENIEALDKTIKDDIENYQAQNVYKVELTERPEYKLKLVERTKEDNENEIIIALQKKLDITYKYYEIASKENIIEKVDTLEKAQEIKNNIENKTDNKCILTINERTTKDAKEIPTITVETANQNIINQLNIDINNKKEESIADINGIKIATKPVSGSISSRFGESSRIRSSRHTGIDIAAKNGTPIKVVADGKVVSAKYNGSYGYLVKVEHGNGVETWYAHTSKMLVTAGQEVKAGDVIALVGSTGNSTGPHLHFEVRINGKQVNPQNYLYN